MDKLLYGKSEIKNVVGLEVNDGHTEIFQQNTDGSVSNLFIDNKFWILSDSNINGKFAKLNGELHYKYGTQFSDRESWSKARSIWKVTNDIFTIWNAEEATMVKDGICFYQDLKQKDVSLLSFDLETTGLDGNADDAKVLLISTTYRDNKEQINKLFSYDDYENEKELIKAFCKYVQEKNPSLLIGHNIIGYDFPYLQARADHNNTKLILGRDKSEIKFASYDSNFRLDGTRDLTYKAISIYGREIVDCFLLAVSFDVSKSLESYGLKPMIKQLGFEKKGRQHYDASQIRKNYKIKEEWEKIKNYAIDDAEDCVKLWDYMGPLYFNMAPMMPKPFTEILLSASGSKINGMMIRAYLQDKHSIPKADETKKYEGAISFAVPGIYSNCFKIDLASLYPSIMIEYEVYDDKKDPKGYLLQFVKTFRAKRLEYKKLAADTNDNYWKELDTTAKGILNSFYGFCGTSGLNFNSMDCAEFITAKGREILEFTIKWASGKNLSEFITEDAANESE
jgi:DNA polymerase elongation subunit (family B)